MSDRPNRKSIDYLTARHGSVPKMPLLQKIDDSNFGSENRLQLRRKSSEFNRRLVRDTPLVNKKLLV